MGYLMLYLTSTIESAIISAQNQICSNCNLPNNDGTSGWDVPTKAINEDLWFIAKPPSEGWGNDERFTQEQMMSGIDLTNIVERERDPLWFPPPFSPF